MNEKCFTRNPLVRDGVSQPQRILKTLLPAYVDVDERSMKELVEFAFKYSDELHYFNSNNSPSGTWKEFFELTTDWNTFSLEDFLAQLRVDQQAKPHLALFFGFLYMFKMAQADMNTITQRHLDFYYREVLQLKENPAIPDQVAVIFDLAKHVDSYQIKKGTILKAGKDDLGVERWYKVIKDVAVNKASITQLKALYVDKKTSKFPSRDHSVYTSPIANSADGKGAKIENESKSWETFGKDNPLINRSFADLGFAIASPLLFLEEGQRIVTITFNLPNVTTTKTLDNNLFNVYFSGEEEWIIPESNASDLTKLDASTNKLLLKRTLSPDQLAVVKYNPENLTDSFTTNWPVVKITLDQETSQNAATNQQIYEKLKSLEPDSVTIKVEVYGVKKLILQNDQAVLDASKPFQPFGNRPNKGSNFYIGNWEVFQKKLNTLSLDVKWKDLPETSNGFRGHYLNYYGDTDGSERSNNDFKVHVALIDKKEWLQIGTTNFNLFTVTGTSGTALGATASLPGPAAGSSRISISPTTVSKRNPHLLPFEDYNTSTKKGFLRLNLRGADFGHAIYPKSFSTQSIKLATWNGTGAEPALPNDPYTPTIETLELNYSSEITLQLKTEDSDHYQKDIEQYFYVHPFGVSRLDTTGQHLGTPVSPKPKNYLLPQYNAEGSLFIGIEGLKPPQTLSVLFQHAEGSANPDAEKQTITWSYLKDNYWIDLDNNKHILADGTDGLLNTGIIWFDIPELITNTNSLLQSGYFWLRASVPEQADAVCDLVDVRAQAVLATFDDHDNDPDHLRNPLEAETIKKLLFSDSAINKVEQPYASFDGQIKEQQPEFYTRVSERLRHKNRAITIWDYEHLILQKYPDVYKVKCINHTRYDGTLTNYSEIAPGHVTLIVISNVFNKNAVDPLRPKTSLARLSDIDEYIKSINPPCVEIHVKNPVYEEIKVDFQVKFQKNIDIGLHTQKLNKEIKEFLSPWASDCPKEVRFGGRVHKSMILNFVEERSYVDYVTCFKMFHIVPGDPDNNPTKDVDEIVASRAITILGSHDEHKVQFIPSDQEDCVCEDNIIPTAKQMLSIDTCVRHLDPEDIPDEDLVNDSI
jgi:baseplate J-like protein